MQLLVFYVYLLLTYCDLCVKFGTHKLCQKLKLVVYFQFVQCKDIFGP